MNRLTLTTATAAALGSLLVASPAAFASDRGYEYARVISATPIVHQVRVSEPRDICTEEPVRERVVYRSGPNPGAILVGGIIGGVIGHQFGGGHGRDVATAAGAVIGAHAGAVHSWQRGGTVERTSYETTCRTVYDTRYRSEVRGYDVAYKYHGRVYHTRMPNDPGKRIRVRWDLDGGGRWDDLD